MRQTLDEEQKQTRLDFAYTVLSSSVSFDTIIFSDESRICLGPDNRFIWRRYSDNDDSVFSENSKFPPGTLVWGAIGMNYKSPLVLVHGSINSQDYIRILKQSRIFRNLNNLLGHNSYIFQQDGAKCHTSKKTIEYLKKQTRFISRWPSNSPDFNPIEMCWAILKHYVKEHHPTTIDELKTLVQEAWASISFGTINSLVKSFRYRLELCTIMRGESITDCIRKGIPESINLILDKTPMNVCLLDKWIEDLVGINDDEELDNIVPVPEPMIVVADATNETCPNFGKIENFPVLFLDRVPSDYNFSPFMAIPKKAPPRTKAKELQSQTIEKIHKCGICGKKIRDANIHRRTNEHIEKSTNAIWRKFDLIAEKLNINFENGIPGLEEKDLEEFIF
jgi:transposase